LLIIDWKIAMPKKTTGKRPELKTVNVGAAAIDIGSKAHMAAVNPACTDVRPPEGSRRQGGISRVTCWLLLNVARAF
jgi:urease beta subunit